MADNAFRVLVLPKEEQADISQFAAKLQEICNRVTPPKLNVEVNPTTLAQSIQTALAGHSFDVTFNTASIATSIQTALTSRTFDINVNPVVQQGGGGSSGGNSGGNGGNGGNGGSGGGNRRQPVGQRDTFAKLVSSQVYLEGLKKKYNSYAYDAPERTFYGRQIYQYSQNLSARKAEFAQRNATTFPEINAAIQQTDQFTKAQMAAAAAAEKTETAFRSEVDSISGIGTSLTDAKTRIDDLEEKKNKLSYRSLMRNLVQRDKDADTETGPLSDYKKAREALQKAFNATQTQEFNAKPVKEQAAAIRALKQQYKDFQKVEKAVVDEINDYKGHTGKYGNNFFDELAEGIGKKFGWAVMAAGAREMRQAIVQLYNNVTELDAALTQISIVTGTSGGALKEFANDAANVAQTVGSTTSAIISSTETYARLGYNLSDSLNLADVTARYANVAAVDVDSATDSLTSIMKSFNIAPTEMEGVVDKLVKVGQEYAISAGELGEAMQRGGAAMAAGGATLDETIALFTAGEMYARAA